MQRISLRTLAVMIYDLVIICAAFYIAVALINFDAVTFSGPFVFKKIQSFAIIVVSQFLCFYLLGLYRAILRFSSIPDLIRIIRGVSLATPLSFFAVFLLNRLENIPRTSFIIDWLLLLIGLSAGRVAYRMMKDNAIERLKRISAGSYKRTFIVGAGIAGERLLREISFNPTLPLSVTGFIDDDPKKIGKSIRGVNIFGPIKKIPELIVDHEVQHVIIAMPSATQAQIRHISQICRDLDRDIELKILPKMIDIIEGKVSYQSLRNIEPEDLLGRQAHNLDVKQMSDMLKDKVILITGAGGSIGSELCKQVAKFQPKLLVLYELTELFLYELELTLKDLFPELKIQSVIGDVRNLSKLNHVFESFKPDVVFHSAAYKHVPLMELNPLEAIRTNVVGTYNVARISAKNNVSRFVLISTDKAINPTNIMGATKRIAELVCQQVQTTATTDFLMVRFGNVLGSSGSVIPLFKKQIERGGPVTVTHPEMRRYFMSIPEATQLVIQAGSLGKKGEVMVLDMGEPMKIYDLAKEMIALSGHRPEVDIKIEFTGLRPGEKLFEELFHENEMILPTLHPMVKIARASLPQKNFAENLDYLIRLPDGAPLSAISDALRSLVPEYNCRLSESKSDLMTDAVLPKNLD